MDRGAGRKPVRLVAQVRCTYMRIHIRAAVLSGVHAFAGSAGGVDQIETGSELDRPDPVLAGPMRRVLVSTTARGAETATHTMPKGDGRRAGVSRHSLGRVVCRERDAMLHTCL